MEQKPSASELAKAGLAHWEEGELAEAETKTRQALALLPDDHWAATQVRGQLASILSALGRTAEARQEFERTLNAELRRVGGETGHPSLRPIRYFFGEHLVRNGDPAGALDILGPALRQTGESLLRMVEADAYLALGQPERAVESLKRGLEVAHASDIREEIQERISKLKK